MKFTTVQIGNEFKKEVATQKVEKLQAITAGSFYNVEYLICPIGGSFDILAQSTYEFDGDAEKELLSYITFALFNNI